MKKFSNKLKFPILLLCNSLPMILNILLYSLGAPSELLLFPLFFGVLIYLNYRLCEKPLTFALIQVFMAGCIFISGYISTSLYYQNISDDGLTLAVGMLMTFVELAIAGITTMVILIIKIIQRKKKEQLSL